MQDLAVVEEGGEDGGAERNEGIVEGWMVFR
jgi:hypothetical protein